MNILYVTNMYPDEKNPVYGIFVKEQIEEYRKQYKEDNIEVFIIKGQESKMSYITSIIEINKKIKKTRYDVIHIHYGLAGLFVLFNKLPFNSKIVLTLHGGDILTTQRKFFQVFLTKQIIKRANHVIVLNREMDAIISKTKVPFSLITCGVDTEVFIYDRNYVPATNELKILFPSSPSRWVKNYTLFKEVINRIKSISNKKIIELCVDGLDREQVVKVMNESSCLLMTSFSEGSPQVVKEALSCGLPVVSVDVGDVSEQISGIDGCFICDNEVITLSEKVINATLSNRAKVRDSFLEKKIYSNSYIIKRIKHIYMKL